MRVVVGLLTASAALVLAPAALAAPPANDLPGAAQQLTGSLPVVSSTVDITDATTTSDPPTPSCQATISRSVWYRYTPASTVDVEVSTAADAPTTSTVNDTVLGIYTSTGGAAGPFTEIPTGNGFDGCDDDSAANEPSQAELRTRLNGGTEYWFVVWKFQTSAPGVGDTDVQLRIRALNPPANDLATGAQTISAASFPSLSATVDIGDATDRDDPPTPSCSGALRRSAWYRFTPSGTGTFEVSTAADAPTATTFDDTTLAIYTSGGGASGPFTELPTAGDTDGCDDDGAVVEPSQSELTTVLQGGTEYWIVVGDGASNSPTAGNTNVQLRINRLLDADNPTAATARELRLNRPETGNYRGGVNDYALPPASPCFSGLAQVPSTLSGLDVVFRFEAPTAGSYSFRAVGIFGSDPVIAVADSLPAPAPMAQTISDCLGASNRNTSDEFGAEEVSPLSLAAGQEVFMVLDQDAVGSGEYEVTVERTIPEANAGSNNTPGTAGGPSCGMRGSLDPAGDVDFFSLGTPAAANSRLFAMADGVAGRDAGTFVGDTELRATTATDTLEYDDLNLDGRYGEYGALLAGTPLPASPNYLRVNEYENLATEPYHLYSVVQPPAASATPEGADANDTIGQADTSPINYLSGALSTATDVDVYAFTVPARSSTFVALDAVPTRDATAFNPAVELLDSTGAVLLKVDDAETDSTLGSSATLSGMVPSFPSEGLLWRSRTATTLYLRVSTADGLAFVGSNGDYLLSIAPGCKAGASSALTITPPTLPNATLGTAYNQALSVSGGSGPYQFELDSGSLPAGLGLSQAGVISGTPTSAGSSSFTVLASDSNGLTGTRQYTVTVPGPTTPPPPGGGDTTAPDTKITKGPKKKIKTKTAKFEFSANEAATFECQVDKGSFSSCSSPFTTKKLKPGKHTFSVRAKDSAGNVDASPATQSFTYKKKKKKK